ncbi:MAG: Multidrug resistance protein Stp [Chlamydiia bacterium]|nr:Multidrug resistance protein Stp [Chlamydiia bacterium]
MRITLYQKILVFLSTTFALSLLLLESTVIPVAIPAIQKSFSMSSQMTSWVVNSYYFTTAALVIATGRLADIMGYRLFYCLGIIIFALSALSAGCAANGYMLIASRVGQGVGAAMIWPSAISIILRVFPPSERGKAIGMSSGISSLFISLGPFVAGFIIQFISWRWVFFISIPFAIFGVGIGFFSIPSYEHAKERFDLRGCILLILSIALLVGGVMEFSHARGIGKIALVYPLLFVLIGCLMVWHNQRTPVPFFDFSLFRYPQFILGIVIIFCVQFVVVNPVFWSLFLQKALKLSAIETGLLTMLSTLPALIFAPTSGYLADKYKAETPISMGFVSIIGAYSFLLLFGHFNMMWLLIIGFILHGSGISLIFTPTNTSALGSVPVNQRAVATGVYNTMRFLGATIGVTLLGGINTTVKGNELDHLSKSMVSHLVTKQQVEKVFYQYSPSVRNASPLSDGQHLVLRKGYIESSYRAFQFENGLCLLISCSAFGFCFYYLSSSSRRRLENSFV